MKIKISMRRKVLIGIMFTSVLFGMGAKFRNDVLRMHKGDEVTVICPGGDIVTVTGHGDPVHGEKVITYYILYCK